MDVETLKREAERLSRTAHLLRSEGGGTVAGYRYDSDGYAISRPDGVLLLEPESDSDSRARIVPAAPPGGEPLYSAPLVSLPPIDAIFLRGNDEIGGWLSRNAWERTCPYNPNFGDSDVVDAYEGWWQDQHPFYTGEGVAILGGWHFAWPDDDWHELVDRELVMWTLQGEPWVEVWAAVGGYQVVERLT